MRFRTYRRPEQVRRGRISFLVQVVAITVVAVMVSVALANDASAHHGDLTATTDCIDGERVVTWSQGWENVPKKVTGVMRSRTGNGPWIERGSADGTEGRRGWTVTYPGDTTVTPWEYVEIKFSNGHKIDSARRVEGLTKCAKPEPAPEPSPTPDPTPSPTPEPSPTPTPTPSPEPSPSLEPSPSPEPTPTPDPTPTPSPTPTPTSSPEPTPSEPPAPSPDPEPTPDVTIPPCERPDADDDCTGTPEPRETKSPKPPVDDDVTDGPELAATGIDARSAGLLAALLIVGGGLFVYLNRRNP